MPLTGAISLAQPTASLVKDQLQLDETYDKKGTVKIWVTTTNHYKTGGHDEYKLLGEVPVSKEGVSISVKSLPSSFYKIVLEGAVKHGEQVGGATIAKTSENRLYANACADNASVCVMECQKSCRIVVAINQKVN